MLDIQNEMYIYENHKKISKMLNSVIKRQKTSYAPKVFLKYSSGGSKMIS